MLSLVFVYAASSFDTDMQRLLQDNINSNFIQIKNSESFHDINGQLGELQAESNDLKDMVKHSDRTVADAREAEIQEIMGKKNPTPPTLN